MYNTLSFFLKNEKRWGRLYTEACKALFIFFSVSSWLVTPDDY